MRPKGLSLVAEECGSFLHEKQHGTGVEGEALVFFFCLFLGPHLPHLEVPRLGVELELQLPAYTTATATREPRRICDLPHSSRQRRILTPLSQAGDQTHNLMVPRRIQFRFPTKGTSRPCFLIYLHCGQQLPKESTSQEWTLVWLLSTLNSMAPVLEICPRCMQTKHVKDKYAASLLTD